MHFMRYSILGRVMPLLAQEILTESLKTCIQESPATLGATSGEMLCPSPGTQVVMGLIPTLMMPVVIFGDHVISLSLHDGHMDFSWVFWLCPPQLEACA